MREIKFIRPVDACPRGAAECPCCKAREIEGALHADQARRQGERVRELESELARVKEGVVETSNRHDPFALLRGV